MTSNQQCSAEEIPKDSEQKYWIERVETSIRNKRLFNLVSPENPEQFKPEM